VPIAWINAPAEHSLLLVHVAWPVPPALGKHAHRHVCVLGTGFTVPKLMDGEPAFAGHVTQILQGLPHAGAAMEVGEEAVEKSPPP